MKKTVDIRVSPDHIGDEKAIRDKALIAAGWKGEQITDWEIIRKSIDARKQPVYQLRIALYKDEQVPEAPRLKSQFHDVSESETVHIIGAGPAGYFAALRCLEIGLKPVILERGKDVRRRRRDLRAIQQFSIVNPHSNYCFGEGGAGTYSDGKLYTRAQKRGDVQGILQLLVEHGAPEEILVDAHPHIGSNKLPGVVSNIRQSIEDAGGEVQFDSHVTDFRIEEGLVTGIMINNERELDVRSVILATGHSARDIFLLLDKHGIDLEFKPFALGVRIEHPQELIDRIQYHGMDRGEHLPAASYRLACQVGQDRGVFSFCMCPGGLVVPAATAPGEIVVNGMSLSRRDSAYANAGTVVSIEYNDLVQYASYKALAGMRFQEAIEQTTFHQGDGSQKAPASRLMDYLGGKVSTDLPDCSYIPGIFGHSLDPIFPQFISESLRAGIRTFGERMKGYLTNEAVVIATESRTSSPVRIPRNSMFMHPQVSGLFPCGEGAGYAGGIMSAAMDGQRVADAVLQFYHAR